MIENRMMEMDTILKWKLNKIVTHTFPTFVIVSFIVVSGCMQNNKLKIVETFHIDSEIKLDSILNNEWAVKYLSVDPKFATSLDLIFNALKTDSIISLGIIGHKIQISTKHQFPKLKYLRVICDTLNINEKLNLAERMVTVQLSAKEFDNMSFLKSKKIKNFIVTSYDRSMPTFIRFPNEIENLTLISDSICSLDSIYVPDNLKSVFNLNQCCVHVRYSQLEKLEELSKAIGPRLYQRDWK